MTGRDDDVNNITIDINNTTQGTQESEREHISGPKVKSPTASSHSKTTDIQKMYVTAQAKKSRYQSNLRPTQMLKTT